MENYQSKLFPYAYNILGSVEDAKDAVQDIIVNHLSSKRQIENEIGYLIRAVINQSINLKKKRDRVLLGKTWLPEPFTTESADSNINREEIISYSMLVLLEKLTAKERATFILKEAFDYSHNEIADLMDFTTENSRKLLSRAKSKLALSENKINSTPSFDIEHYVRTIKTGNVKELEKLLVEDVSLTADGGGTINVVKEFTEGKEATLELLLYVYEKFQQSQKVKIIEVNHQPALFYRGKGVVNCQVFDIENGKIKRIFSLVGAEKLRGFI